MDLALLGGPGIGGLLGAGLVPVGVDEHLVDGDLGAGELLGAGGVGLGDLDGGLLIGVGQLDLNLLAHCSDGGLAVFRIRDNFLEDVAIKSCRIAFGDGVLADRKVVDRKVLNKRNGQLGIGIHSLTLGVDELVISILDRDREGSLTNDCLGCRLKALY